MKCAYPVFLLFLFVVRSSFGQATSEAISVGFNSYTSLRTHLAVLDKESEFQDNASRIGVNLELSGSSEIKFIGHLELSLRLIESSVTLNADSRTTSGFIILDRSQEAQVFGARLGYLGVDLGAYGRITVGKQWSTYYDVSGITDRFNVFGGTTSNTYAGGTDGSVGTGRSDQSFIYRLDLGKWHLGTQLLFNSTTNDTFVDGYGGNIRYDLFPGFQIGAAYQYSIVANDLVDGILGLDGDPEFYCVGVSYQKDELFLSAVYAGQTNGDLTVGLLNQEEAPTVFFDDTGFEFAAAYALKKWRFLGGVNMEWAKTDGLPIHPDYHTENYILGMEFRPNRLAYLYSEFRYDRGVDARGNATPSVFTLGLRLDLSHKVERTLEF